MRAGADGNLIHAGDFRYNSAFESPFLTNADCLADNSISRKRSLVKRFDRFVTWLFGIIFLLSEIPHWGNPY
jgi:hypothetical protein